MSQFAAEDAAAIQSLKDDLAAIESMRTEIAIMSAPDPVLSNDPAPEAPSLRRAAAGQSALYAENPALYAYQQRQLGDAAYRPPTFMENLEPAAERVVTPMAGFATEATKGSQRFAHRSAAGVMAGADRAMTELTAGANDLLYMGSEAAGINPGLSPAPQDFSALGLREPAEQVRQAGLRPELAADPEVARSMQDGTWWRNPKAWGALTGETAPTVGSAIVITAITKNPQLGLAFAGASAAGSSFEETRARKMDAGQSEAVAESEAVGPAVMDGVIEAAFESMGIGRVFGRAVASNPVAKRTFIETVRDVGMRVAGSAAEESLEEVGTELVQSFNDRLMAENPEAFADIGRRLLVSGTVGAAFGGALRAGTIPAEMAAPQGAVAPTPETPTPGQASGVEVADSSMVVDRPPTSDLAPRQLPEPSAEARRTEVPQPSQSETSPDSIRTFGPEQRSEADAFAAETGGEVTSVLGGAGFIVSPPGVAEEASAMVPAPPAAPETTTAAPETSPPPAGPEAGVLSAQAEQPSPAEQLSPAEQFVEGEVDRPRRTQALRDLADRMEKAALDRIAKRQIPRGGRSGGSTIPGDLADYAVVGATKILKGTANVADFTAQMTEQFGDAVAPVASCSRAGIDYTPGDHERRSMAVASCSRAGIDYTFCRVKDDDPLLRVARGLGSITLRAACACSRLPLRVARGLGSITLAGPLSACSRTLRVARGLGSITLTPDPPSISLRLRVARGLGSITLVLSFWRITRRLRVARGLGSITLK